MLHILWEQLQACWANINQGCNNKLIRDMHLQVEEVCKARGEITRFWNLDLVDITYSTLSL